MLQIVRVPDSVTDLTTNSSSMLYVMFSNEESAKAVDAVIQSSSLRSWFGKQKVVVSLLSAYRLARETYHVSHILFPNLGHEEYDWNEEDHPGSLYKLEGEEREAKIEAIRQYHNRAEDRGIKSIRSLAVLLCSAAPIYYYEAGEDNEIRVDDWDFIHQLPLNGARLG